MRQLRDLIAGNQDWLVSRILYYAGKHDYLKYSSTLEEAWRMSVAGLSQAIYAALQSSEQELDLGPGFDFTRNPVASFSILEAKRHRDRGVTLEMFMSLMKYYRQSYIDLISQAGFDRYYEERCRFMVIRVFDVIEIGFCTEWAKNPESVVLAELQSRNRDLTNEKNKYLTALESLPNPVILLDGDNYIDYMNFAAAELCNESGFPGTYYYNEEKAGKTLSWLAEELKAFVAGNDMDISFEKALQNEDSIRYFDVKLARMMDFSAKFKGTIVILIRDITSRKQAEEVLRLYQLLFERARDIFLFVSLDGRITDANEAACLTYGYNREELLKLEIEDLRPSETRALIKQEMSRAVENGILFETVHRRKDGSTFPVEVSSQTAIINDERALFSVIRDISDRKEMEREMTRLERLNLVGEMAAGIGHEIRNPMTTVRGFLQILAGKKELTQYDEWFALMIDELNRANTIIKDYLSLAKNKVINLKYQNINNILKEMQPLLMAAALESNMNIVCKPGEVAELLLDENEIRQLVLNLVQNGLEAMTAGGELMIRTLMDGSEVVLAVQDQGTGIEPQIIDKIGTPFFTTKDYGTGLGLAVCYSIATRHNATIKMETGDKGTAFLVRFKI